MTLFLLGFAGIVLSFVCWEAIVLYLRIPDFLPTRADEDDEEAWIAGRRSSTPPIAPAEFRETLVSRLTPPAGLVDAAAWRHYERTRRMAARLDAIVMQPATAREAPRRSAAPSGWIGTRWRNLLWGVWLAALLAVIVGSLLPSDTAPIQALNSLGINDKIMHFVAYVFLALLPAIHEKPVFSIIAGVAMIALGAALECGQLYSPGRSFEGADIAADALGVSLGLLVGIPFQGRIAALAANPDWRRVFGANRDCTRHEIQSLRSR